MPSVIEPLKPYVKESFLKIAPEHAPELEAFVSDCGCQLAFDESSPGWIAKVDLDTGLITLGCQLLEAIWAQCYCCWMMWSKHEEIVSAAHSLDDDKEVLRANELMAWAVERQSRPHQRSYPTHLPRPEKRDRMDHTSTEASNLMCGVAAFLILHEIAHLHLRHVDVGPGASPMEQSWGKEQEREADQRAAAWMLDQLDEDSGEYLDRTGYLAMALALMVAKQIHFPSLPQRHPASHDRLFSLLDQYVHDPCHLAWCLAAILLGFHSQIAGETVDIPPGSSCRDAVSIYADYLSRPTPPAE